ncbi:Serine_threonine-protein kinase PknD [Nocardiopsis dassonvillei]|uniref:WD40 repeat domain-containing serine/threonine protein kinase n=1 Tax=Nocardiopsis dassonvillei TaxID=2014 RepID=UPI003F56FC68
MESLRPTDPPRIGPYHLVSRLGAGGMGQVYLARTPSGRRLVVKVIRPDLTGQEGFRARFAREADAARRVGGFHTAQVVDADPDADAPWIATAHIPGPSLGQAVREYGPITPPALYVLATGLAEGLQAIHACGLVHRDLKPANIILADDGPRIIDFGIARPLDADSMTTRGAVFGTLPYMSPEQTEGSRVGPASDMFSLGTVLAYAATGTNPFQGATMAETLRRLISPPPHPGEFDPDLGALVIECWNHDPDRRPTPERILTRFEKVDLHDSWPSFDTDTEIRSAPMSAPPSPTETPLRAQAGPARSPYPATEPVGPVLSSEIQEPTHIRDGNGLPQSRIPASPQGPSPDTEPRKSNAKLWMVGLLATTAVFTVLAVFLWNTFTPGRLTLARHGGVVHTVAFSPDGTTLATGGGERNGTARLWDVDTGEHLTTLTHNDYVESVSFSPDGAALATGGGNDNGAARLWDVGAGEISTLTDHQSYVYSVAFSPDGAALATGGTDGTARLWNADTGEHITTLTGHNGAVQSVAFSPDSTTLATGSTDHTARLWNADTGEHLATLTGHMDNVWAVAFSPEGALLATGGADGTARLWNADTGEHITTLTGHNGAVQSVAFSPNGTTLATGGADHTARLWNADTGEHITTLTGHNGAVRSVAFSPNGTTLATGGADGTARLWNVG